MSVESAARAAPIDQLLETIGAAQALIAEARLDSVRLGLDRAALYVAGAAGNLRIASANAVAATRRMSSPSGHHDGLYVLGETGFGLRATGERMVGERVRVSMKGGTIDVRPASDDDEQPSPPNRNLAVDLLKSETLRLLVSGPIFAALLEDALARHDWWCRQAQVQWHSNIASASSVVDALSGARWRPRFGPKDSGGLVDAQVAAELAKLGWVPMGEVLSAE